jgi:hypothetical protein
VSLITHLQVVPTSKILDIYIYSPIRLHHPRVEAGKNTSTVIPASRKRQRKGNPVVSDDTVMYGPLTIDDCSTNYRTVLSSERAPQNEEQSNFPSKERKK